jgi:arginyl-tRNA--protein-N-Asp/Glu arginylyltransferase
MIDRFRPARSLAPGELEALLAQGWFRLGQQVFTTGQVPHGLRVHPAVWLRLPLGASPLHKSLRRVMREVERRFAVDVVPFRLGPDDAETPDKVALYARYVAFRRGTDGADLGESLLDDAGDSAFDSWSVEVREAGRLVAFSVFDLAGQAVQSVLGAFEPALATHGLGVYTMVAEVCWAAARGLDWYYPGYVAPGWTVFDYKLRLRGLEALDPSSGAWVPFREVDVGAWPAVQQDRAFHRLEAHLTRLGVPWRRIINEAHQIPEVEPRFSTGLRFAAYVELGAPGGPEPRWAVLWDPSAARYLLVALELVGRLVRDAPPACSADGRVVAGRELRTMQRLIARGRSARRIAGLAAEILAPDGAEEE